MRKNVRFFYCRLAGKQQGAAAPEAIAAGIKSNGDLQNRRRVKKE
jgi:hypothetical protein